MGAILLLGGGGVAGWLMLPNATPWTGASVAPTLTDSLPPEPVVGPAPGTRASTAPADRGVAEPVIPAPDRSALAAIVPVVPPEVEAQDPGTLRGIAVLPSPTAPPAAQAVPLASEAELIATTADRAVMLRLRDNPAVFVLLFPTLDEQGAALNRVAALVEKAGLPRDRLLTDAELDLAIARSGEKPATWFLGHDYQGSDLARFLALADRDGIALTPAEAWVRARFAEARALVPEGVEIALISTANADHRFDPAMRATILRHEISHGHFFTRPEVRAHVLRVWRERFRERDRQLIRGFLEREGYDAGIEALMANEAMAYLLFTPDPRFFSARLLGATEAELARMRTLMREGLPLP